MTDKLTRRAITCAEADAQAFGLTAAFNRIEFIKGLVEDPATSVFSKDVVRWLVTALENERIGRSNDQTSVKRLQDRVAELEARQPMPKGKAIVKLAKVVARQAEAIASVNQNTKHYDGLKNDDPDFVDLLETLNSWRESYEATIEAASYGD